MFKRVIQRRIEGRFLAGFDDELPKSFARRRRSKFSIAMSSRVGRAGNATILRDSMCTAGLLSDSTHVNAPSRKRRTENFPFGGLPWTTEPSCLPGMPTIWCLWAPVESRTRGPGDIRWVCRSVCGPVLGRGRLRCGLIRAVSGHRRGCRRSGRSRLWPNCARRWCVGRDRPQSR